MKHRETQRKIYLRITEKNLFLTLGLSLNSFSVCLYSCIFFVNIFKKKKFNFLSGIPPVRRANRYLVSIFSFLIIFSLIAYSQDIPKKFVINGYLSNMQSTMFDSINKNWLTDNMIHNRINMKLYPVEGFIANLELRNRFIYGESVTKNPGSKANYEKDFGVVDLAKNIFKGNSYILNSSVDRLNFSYEKDKFKATLGRQRINWGQTFVWNPNDIFNAYSFFDFDYVERPGSDALRFQYYNTEVSSTELAIKMNSDKKVTAAGYYKFNAFEYDIQLISGILNNEDFVIGTGWSGAIKSISLRGEISYFHPKNKFLDTSGIFLASFGLDYSFGNSLMIMAEYLYCGTEISDSLSFLKFYGAPQTVKNLSFVKHNVVVQVSYPFTPLLNGSLAGMYLPGIDGYYLGPSLSYSLADNLDATFFIQSFGGKIEGKKQRFNLGFIRVKYSF
jgi:hypothetical protein